MIKHLPAKISFTLTSTDLITSFKLNRPRLSVNGQIIHMEMSSDYNCGGSLLIYLITKLNNLPTSKTLIGNIRPKLCLCGSTWRDKNLPNLKIEE